MQSNAELFILQSRISEKQGLFFCLKLSRCKTVCSNRPRKLFQEENYRVIRDR